MPRRLKLTMDDVARAAHVSKQTVSAVINNKSGISEKTRARIRKIIARLDYQPNMLASALRGQSSFTVGVVIPSITNPFYPEFVRGIEDEAQRPLGLSEFACQSPRSVSPGNTPGLAAKLASECAGNYNCHHTLLWQHTTFLE
jgi:transcriptional regulator with XRE-family HTH domain